MALITFDGSGVLPATGTAHIVLSCTAPSSLPAIPDTLLLMEFPADTTAYNGRLEGFDVSDGRSLAGSLKAKGNLFRETKIWNCAFMVVRPQIDLFHTMMAAQRLGGQIALNDNFESVVGTTNVYVDLDDSYLTPIDLEWHLLQFSAREEL